jgi:hypothetical protein
MKIDVGRSHRTPAKHDLMWTLVGQEIGVANVHRDIDRLVIIDLTSGDGIPSVNDAAMLIPWTNGWAKNCSPGISAWHGRNSKKPLEIILHEIAPNTFLTLVQRLKVELATIGYELSSPNLWRRGNTVRLLASNMSGSMVDLDSLRINNRTSVLVLNDPNTVHSWAMRPTLAREINQRTPWFRSISTMGCNVGGLKQLSAEDRSRWYDQIDQLRNFLQNHHDLFLAKIDNDASQWAYLIETSAKDNWKYSLEKHAEAAFGKHGFTLTTAWLKFDRIKFDHLLDVLFKTRKELR